MSLYEKDTGDKEALVGTPATVPARRERRWSDWNWQNVYQSVTTPSKTKVCYLLVCLLLVANGLGRLLRDHEPHVSSTVVSRPLGPLSFDHVKLPMVWSELNPFTSASAPGKAPQCPAQPKTIGKGQDWNVPQEYPRQVANRLSKAIQIDTTVHDNMGPIGEDDRWKAHEEFNSFLENEFQRVYDHLNHTTINTYAHLFTWKGSNPDLAPILLMAHQDVVPVNKATEDQWTHGPFEGYIDDTWVWGRGSGDCKNLLMGQLNAVEKLIDQGFEPERTILLAYGFDEEIDGQQGAVHLAKAIEQEYGSDSIAFLVDEGFGGIIDLYGSRFASLGMAEKGAIDIRINVDTVGGHSSTPPPHTGIGILSQAVVALEDKPYKPSLGHGSPYLTFLTCLADHAPELPKLVKKAIKTPKLWKRLARSLSKDPKQYAFLATTQAVDVINGGVKFNALPEHADAVVNHRIDFTSSVKETKQHMTHVLARIAKAHNLKYIAFGKTIDLTSHHGCHGNKQTDPAHEYAGTLSLESVSAKELEPAPITSPNEPAYELIGGTFKKVFGEDVVIAPSAMFANTDTKHYWNLTKSLYRFLPLSMGDVEGFHTVNERIKISAHVTTIEYFYHLLQNTQEWRDRREE